MSTEFATNPFKLSGYYVYHWLWYSRNYAFCPQIAFTCFYVDVRTQLYTNWSVCITETECVHCAVQTGSLYIILCFVWISEQTAIISLYRI